MHLTLDHHRIEHVAAIVDRGVGRDIDMPGVGIDLDFGDVHAIGKRQRRVGLVLGVEAFAACPWRGARSRTTRSCGRCRPLRNCRCGIGCRTRTLPAGRGDFLALGQHHVGGMHDGVAGGHRRARTDRGKADDLARVSPCRCTIVERSMPSLSASRRPNTVAWLCPVDCTLSAKMSLSPPGKLSERFRSAARRHVRACRKCRCREVSCAWPTRACAWRNSCSRTTPAPWQRSPESRRCRKSWPTAVL